VMKAFDCKMCGTCCHGEGGIFVNIDEMGAIADFLDIDTEAFSEQYCYENHGRVYLKTGNDNFCIFFDKEKSCLIHIVKPQRCCEWPFFRAIVKDETTWKMAQEACPGINPKCSFEEFVRQSKSAGKEKTG